MEMRVLVTLGECHQEPKVVVTPEVDFQGLEVDFLNLEVDFLDLEVDFLGLEVNPVDSLEHQQEECQEERHPVGHHLEGRRPEGHHLEGHHPEGHRPVHPEGHPESLLQKKKLA